MSLTNGKLNRMTSSGSILPKPYSLMILLCLLEYGFIILAPNNVLLTIILSPICMVGIIEPLATEKDSAMNTFTKTNRPRKVNRRDIILFNIIDSYTISTYLKCNPNRHPFFQENRYLE